MLGASKLMLGGGSSNFGNSTVTGNVTSGAFYSNTVGRSTYLTFLNTITYEVSPVAGISSFTSTFGNLVVEGNTAVIDILLVGGGGPSVSTIPGNCNGGGGGQVRFYSNVIVPPGVYPLQVNKPKRNTSDTGANGIATLTIGGTVYQANPGSDGSSGGTLTGGSAGGGARSTSTLYGASGYPIYSFGSDVTWIGGLSGNIWYGAGGSGVITNSPATNTINAGGTNTGGAGQDPQGYSPSAQSGCYGVMHTGGGAGGGYNGNGATYENVPGTGVIIIRKINPPVTYSVDYLAVAGGGSGGSRIGGGGGAGGLLSGTFTATQGTVYTATIGAGGTAVTSTPGVVGNNGANTSISATGFSTVTAVGGGGGGAYIGTSGTAGKDGGSGGGGSYSGNGGVNTAGSGTSAQGNAGGAGSATIVAGGGGGGAGAAGATPPSTGRGGDGGIGTQSSITGAATYYAGGGGGSSSTTTTVGAGGNGGGGAGSNSNNNATAGTANTGGGGGGARNDSDTGSVVSGAGGSGVVILSVPTANYTGTITGSPTVTTSGSNTIIKFTSSGTYTA